MGNKDASKAKQLLCHRAVLKLFCPDLKIENKYKRFLILAISDDKSLVAKLYFSSNCPYIPYQVPFEANGRKYLDNQSYLDCSEIYEDNYNRILTELIKSPTAYIGQMSELDFRNVITQIEIANTITPFDKKKFGITDKTK